MTINIQISGFYGTLCFVCLIFLQACNPKTLPDKELLIKDVRFLASDDLKGRKTGSDGNAKARDFIIKQFKSMDVQPVNGRYEAQFAIEGKKDIPAGINIIGKIKGKKEEAIIITAHYDHVGVSATGEVFNGADDNASGVAGLLAMARYFSANPPTHMLFFVALDAEEIGLLGAKHFAKNLPVDQSLVKVNINMDMISRSDKNEIYVAGTAHYPHLKPAVAAVAKSAPIKLSMGHDRAGTSQQDWTFSSDHAPFHRLGIPFLYFGVEDHADYHQITDDVEKIEPQFLENTTKAILDVVIKIDQQ